MPTTALRIYLDEDVDVLPARHACSPAIFRLSLRGWLPLSGSEPIRATAKAPSRFEIDIID